jgi:hypothetical protein
MNTIVKNRLAANPPSLHLAAISIALEIRKKLPGKPNFPL